MQELVACSQHSKSSSLGVQTSSLCALAHHLRGLVPTNTSTPVTALLLVFVSTVNSGLELKSSVQK